MKIDRNIETIVAFVRNIVLVYVAYFICRVEYMLENWAAFRDNLFDNPVVNLVKGQWMFDTSAILYTNALYALMMLLPLHYKEKRGWQKAAKWVWMVTNGLCVVLNIGDSVYFRYTGKRTTNSVFGEFSNDGNLGSIFGVEVVNHWYLFIFGILLLLAMWRLYTMPKQELRLKGTRKYLAYYMVQIVALALYVPLTIGGMRGGFTTAVRPITISNANQYVNRPQEAALILNTPFSIIRTAGKTVFQNPNYFTKEELDRMYSPIVLPTDTGAIAKGKNVVVLIVESFGREYIGAYNEKLDGGSYKGYAPFIDELYAKSLSFDYTFANGRQSIDGMPSILSSIPRFLEPFFLTPASMNDLTGIAGELGKIGYTSAFFHGAENGSMGFEAFAKATGFQRYYGRTEYNQDARFNGDKDFDGMWAIWDEPFLQFYAKKMSEMKQPFVTAVFTASSHHPYHVPEKYQDVYKEEGNNPIHKCIRYTDHALREFFRTASREPWFRNTIFVFTSDHTNIPDHAEYQTDLGVFGAPILIYDPSGTIKPERRHCIAQQIDIMPTVLGMVGYDKPYVAFGKNLMATADDATWAVNYNNGIYQYVKGNYLLQFDGQAVKALYDIKNDWLLTRNLKGTVAEQPAMERELKAIIQSYMERMIGNQLVVR